MSEPTEEMILAGIEAANRTMPYVSDAQCVTEIWKAMQEARAQALPQGVEEWIAEHGLQFVDTLGGYATKLKRSRESQYPWPEYVSVENLRAYLSGMAIVPVDDLFHLQNWYASRVCEISIGESYSSRVKRVDEILMLAAAKEQARDVLPDTHFIMPVKLTEKMIEAALPQLMREDEDKYRALGQLICVWDALVEASKEQSK
jgi:hypothetical protein